MKERIRQIMENENISPAKFADKLQINRAVISHILNGRNNPSLDVVSKILSEMQYINPEWLINGVGEMYKKGLSVDSIPKETDLFSQDKIKPDNISEKPEYTRENDVKVPQIPSQNIVSKLIDPVNNTDKKITQIIIYYSDRTFETFIPHPVK